MALSLWDGAGDDEVESVDLTEFVRDGVVTMSFRRDQNGMIVAVVGYVMEMSS
jgi:hypothetical protein